MTITYKRGILIDWQGFVLALMQWDASDPAPEFNRPRQGRALAPEQIKTLLDGDLYIDGAEKQRWDGSGWEAPDATVWLVDEKGQLRSSERVYSAFPRRRPIVPADWALVTVAPPKDVTQRPYWDGEAWQFPVTKALVDDVTGELLNLVVWRDDLSVAPVGTTAIEPPVDSAGDQVRIGGRDVGGGIWTQPADRAPRRVTMLGYYRALELAGHRAAFDRWATGQGLDGELRFVQSITPASSLVNDFATAEDITPAAMVAILHDAAGRGD